MNPNETFYNSGSDILENPVTLIVTTDFNCSDTVVKPVQVYPGVIVDFMPRTGMGAIPCRSISTEQPPMKMNIIGMSMVR